MVGREKKSKTKTEIRAKKGKENKINLAMTLVSTRTEKKIPSSGWMVHWWVLVHCGW
jgi:hypothetical protein